jgi:hypothetical protein
VGVWGRLQPPGGTRRRAEGGGSGALGRHVQLSAGRGTSDIVLLGGAAEAAGAVCGHCGDGVQQWVSGGDSDRLEGRVGQLGAAAAAFFRGAGSSAQAASQATSRSWAARRRLLAWSAGTAATGRCNGCLGRLQPPGRTRRRAEGLKA